MTSKVQAKILVVLLVPMLVSVSANSVAQSLGEIARQYRKEREAREKDGKVPVKIFTNDDVVRVSPPATADSWQRKPSTPPSLPAPEAKQSESLRPAGTAGREITTEAPSGQTSQAEDRVKSKEYWQARFTAARAALSHAKEEQNLVEDELRLLQIQQARELDPERSRKLNSRIDAKASELETKRAATEKARAELDKTEKDFKKSGAPEDWIQDEKSPHESSVEGARLSHPGAVPPRHP